jgi:hypothetical protein
MKNTGWSQTKIHKFEAGKLTRVLVDDVFEVALALDISPLYLLTPLEGHDEDGNALKVWLGAPAAHKNTAGGRVRVYPSYSPRDLRQWARGVRPLLTSATTARTKKLAAGIVSTCSSRSPSPNGS